MNGNSGSWGKRRQATLCAVTLILVPMMSGCIALALAPAAPLVGGMVSGSNNVTIDEQTVSPELRNALKSSKRIAFLSLDPAVGYMAEYLDSNSNYEISAEEPPKGATPSQRRAMAREICEKGKTDIVLAPGNPSSDAGSGVSNVGAMLLGRAIVNTKVVTDVLVCRSAKTDRFSYTINLNQGVFNMDSTKVSQVVGEEAGKAFLQFVGN